MTAPRPLDLAGLGQFPLPAMPRQTDKNSRGRVLVVGGGAWGPGAALLCGLAALRAGAGKVQVAAADRFASALAIAFPEAAILTVPSTSEGEFLIDATEVLTSHVVEADAIIVGPGMLDKDVAAAIAIGLAACPGSGSFVLDAGALTGLQLESALGSSQGRLVLTPHAGEMASLLGREIGVIEADPLTPAREVATALKAVVIMKGPHTFVVSPDGSAWLHRDGVVGLATSGSGDVLSGVVGGLLARGAPALSAAAWGVCVHARAGRRLSASVAETGFLARELLAEIPAIIERRD